MKQVKICDVKNIYEARTLGEFGVDFIGLHYVSERDKKRSEDLKMIIRLCHQDHPKTKSILVTKETKIDVLIAMVNEFECDGLQLHYAAEPVLLAKLRAHFGEQLLLFAVASPDMPLENNTLRYIDYLIVDKSYLGGTGTRLTADERRQLLRHYKGKKILLAGGVDETLIGELLDSKSIVGFDIQSSVKSNKKDEYENISLQRLRSVLGALGRYDSRIAQGQVGLSCVEDDILLEFYGASDFWHFDFFDDVFGLNTNIDAIVEAMYRYAEMNSHFRFQVHIFSSRIEYINKVIDAVKDISVKTLEYYIHHNDETVRSFVLNDNVYASVDTKDIISGSFPLKGPISRERIILCLQSERHIERGTNANAAMKIIRELWKKNMRVTLDRGIFPGDLNYALEQKVDVVSGRYLRSTKKEGYNELRRSLKNVK